tara:strand:- start:29 stop:157 length:129 start_codon:yes stop_codon:yes gene_type:complete
VSSLLPILYVVVGVVEGEDEDEGDTFAISKLMRFYNNAMAML